MELVDDYIIVAGYCTIATYSLQGGARKSCMGVFNHANVNELPVKDRKAPGLPNLTKLRIKDDV